MDTKQLFPAHFESVFGKNEVLSDRASGSKTPKIPHFHSTSEAKRSECVGLSACVKHSHVVQSKYCKVPPSLKNRVKCGVWVGEANIPNLSLLICLEVTGGGWWWVVVVVEGKFSVQLRPKLINRRKLAK